MSSLLPTNTTTLEQELEAATKRLADLPAELIKDIGDPERCPAELLPLLAWAYSVDVWDPAWTEQTKRDVIEASVWVHQHKGTRGALERAMNALGYPVEITEYGIDYTDAPPYTFRLDVDVTDRGLDEQAINTIERTALAAKNARSKLARLRLYLTTRGNTPRYGIGLVTGEICAVYPHQVTEIGL